MCICNKSGRPSGRHSAGSRGRNGAAMGQLTLPGPAALCFTQRFLLPLVMPYVRSVWVVGEVPFPM